jgi:hypothetical protein
MLTHVVSSCLSLALVLIPGAVFGLAARRLWLSRSRNGVLYWLVGGYAFAGMSGAMGTGVMGAQVDAGGAVVALASVPLWLLVRTVAMRAQAYGARPVEGPVFASVRGPGARGGLREGARGLTPAA